MQSVSNPEVIPELYITNRMDSQERDRLVMENAQLAQALLEMEKELNAAKLATRNLAAWTLNERNRLVTEALRRPL